MEIKDKQAIFITLVFFITISFLFTDYVGFYGKQIDYINDWNCITIGSFDNGEYACESYPPLLIEIGKIFSGREVFFKEFLLVIFGLITPLVIFRISGEPISVFFYFVATNYFWALLSSSFFAQALSVTLILSMYFLKDWQRILVILISIIVHSYAFYLAVFFYLLLAWKESGWGLFFFCSPFWGQKVPDVLDVPLKSGVSHSIGFLNLNVIGSVLIKRTPLHFLVFGVKGLWDRREFPLLVLMLVFFVVGLFFHERSFYFAGLPLVVGLSWYYQNSCVNMKILLIVAGLVSLIFNIEQIILLVLNCIY